MSILILVIASLAIAMFLAYWQGRADGRHEEEIRHRFYAENLLARKTELERL